MEMAVRSMEMAEMAMETDGDGSGGTSPSRQGVGTETYVPQNSSAVMAELQNSSGNFADYFRVFRREASYRQMGVVRRWPRWAHHGWTRPGAGLCPPCGVASLWPLSGSCLVLVLRPGKIGVSELVSSNSENISCVAFLKHKNNRK
jgi:hypothetical protein